VSFYCYKITINTEGVQNLLQHLKPNKATGPDDIPAKFLKEVNIEISPLISFIFQASLSLQSTTEYYFSLQRGGVSGEDVGGELYRRPLRSPEVFHIPSIIRSRTNSI
jgi:hypothetical protein